MSTVQKLDPQTIFRAPSFKTPNSRLAFDFPIQPGKTSRRQPKFPAYTKQKRKLPMSAHVVEDCTSTRLLHCHYLQCLGYETTSSSCVEEAIERCKETQFDLILMDISLPGMNGLDAISLMHDDTSVKFPDQVVFCSGYEPTSIPLQHINHSFLAKPVTRKQITQHLGQLNTAAVG